MIKWKNVPEVHDYPAAYDYLRLILHPKVAEITVMHLQAAEMSTAKAKDILRASELNLLPLDNEHVKQDLRKLLAGEKLTPVLLFSTHNKLYVADGYHRVCLSYHIGENEEVPCKIVYNGSKHE